MAFLPVELARRSVQMGLFRRTPQFEDAVMERVAIARRQPFCNPTEYARARSKTSKIWLEVEKRLEQAEAKPETAAQPKVVSAAPTPAVSALVERGGETRRFCVRLSTDVGPGSPAAELSAMADAGLADVEVILDGSEPMLVYSVASSIAPQEARHLAYEPPTPH